MKGAGSYTRNGERERYGIALQYLYHLNIQPCSICYSITENNNVGTMPQTHNETETYCRHSDHFCEKITTKHRSHFFFNRHVLDFNRNRIDVVSMEKISILRSSSTEKIKGKAADFFIQITCKHYKGPPKSNTKNPKRNLVFLSGGFS